MLCVKFLQESISVSSYENNDIRESRTFTHNYNNLIRIITYEVHYIIPTSPGNTTFEVHHIILTSPGNTLATIFKSILIFYFFSFFAYFSFRYKIAYHAWAYRREKRNTIYVSQISYSCCANDTPHQLHTIVM